MFRVQEISSPERWNAFVVKTTNDTFHQSWEWGQLNERQGGRAWYFGLFEKDALVGVCLAVLIRAKRGNFLNVPHGPLVAPHIATDPRLLQKAIDEYTRALVECARSAG